MDQAQGTWHALPAEEIAETLGTDLERGLTPAEAAVRQKRFGLNELVERKGPSFWQLLLDQFRQFLVIILIVAALISFVLGEWLDGGAIMAIVVLNAVMGVVQEGRAEQALAALKKMAAPKATVVRDGQQIIIPAARIGARRPGGAGDGQLCACRRAPGRERQPAHRGGLADRRVGAGGKACRPACCPTDAPLGDRHNCAYMSTMVTYGRGRGIVVLATGMETEIGKIAEMIQSYEEEPTPLQIKLDQLGKWLGSAACGLVALAHRARPIVFSVAWHGCRVAET